MILATEPNWTLLKGQDWVVWVVQEAEWMYSIWKMCPNVHNICLFCMSNVSFTRKIIQTKRDSVYAPP